MKIVSVPTGEEARRLSCDRAARLGTSMVALSCDYLDAFVSGSRRDASGCAAWADNLSPQRLVRLRYDRDADYGRMLNALFLYYEWPFFAAHILSKIVPEITIKKRY